MRHVRRFRSALWATVWIVALVAAPSWADAEKSTCPGNIKNGTAVSIVIGDSIEVSPDSVEVFMDDKSGPGRVCWLVEGLEEGLTVHIEGKGEEDDHFPGLERTIELPRNFANSGKPGRAGTWRYSVSVTREGVAEPVHFVDPEVIVKPIGR